jgi:hypothetical protein
MFSDGDRLSAEATSHWFRSETELAQFHGHEERERALLLSKGAVPPLLKPLPPHYQLANMAFPTMRTDLKELNTVRENHVFAACGVPRALVMTTTTAADTGGLAVRTINATLHRLRSLVADVFRDMYVMLFPEDPAVRFEVEVELLVDPAEIIELGSRGFLTEDTFARLLARSCNIPEISVRRTLSRTIPWQSPEALATAAAAAAPPPKAVPVDAGTAVASTHAGGPGHTTPTAKRKTPAAAPATKKAKIRPE